MTGGMTLGLRQYTIKFFSDSDWPGQVPSILERQDPTSRCNLSSTKVATCLTIV